MTNNESYERLKNILKELFQLDQADLDFGIYRIMNQKRDEITDFLENRLITQVASTLNAYAGQNKDQLEKEVNALEETLRSAGVNPDTNDKVKALKQQLYTADTTDLQNTTFSHLTNFFKRYYSEGDFISQRRYKDDVYAIPYQGEEVKLHWANHDQYYIKTSEYFKNYRFNLRNGKTINFELAEASTEQNNNKEQNKERKFKLAVEDVFKESEKELTIYFTYEPLSKTLKQDKLMKEAFTSLKEKLPNIWLMELLQPKPTEKDKNRTLLEKHLKEYTARNTFDYFIHKDLGGFLKRELDFYIKNEILHIDDIDLDKEESYRQSLQIIKAFKKVALKIIAFLTQLEEFQKKLWLKKKFVLQSDYCFTLDRVDEDFYEDIVANEEQRKEWIKLYAIDELEDYKESLTVDFLKAHPFLMIDTQFYTREWKYKLLATIDKLDEQTDGLMINSENFQAISLLNRSYSKKIDYIYLDPPYNAQSSEIVYKNNFKHSSWLSLMENRVSSSKVLQKEGGVLTIAIDEVEQEVLGQMLSNVYPDHEKSCITVNHNPSGQQGDNFSYTHEFAYFIYPKPGRFIAEELREDENSWDNRNFRDVTGDDSLRSSGKNCFYPILIKDDEVIGFGEVCEDDYHPSINEDWENGITAVYPIDPEGVERKWRFAQNTVESIKEELIVHYLKKRKVFDIKRLKKKFNFKSNWVDSKYSGNNHGTQILNKILPKTPFTYPKSVFLVRDSILAGMNGKNSGLVLDYFAGSGTTAHSVAELRRSKDYLSNHRFILVEMGEYFETVTKPRTQKVFYSQYWDNGKPVDRRGLSNCFKYLRLESYEDSLNNLSLNRSSQQQQMLGNGAFSEEYTLRYMMEVESRESLLNTEMFKRPFGYTIQATEHNERVETEVDLVETFNYLIGLTVESMQLIRGYVVVVGHSNSGEHILVIWRDTDIHSNENLEAFCDTMEFNPHDNEFDLIYVNGDNNLQNLRKDEETWKVRLIEEAFHTLMFEQKGL